jgi:catalase-peroxidase
LSTEAKCPVLGRRSQTHGGWGPTNADWWPNQLNLKILHQHSPLSDPMDKEFNYAKEFKSLDLDAVIKDLHALMTDIAGLVARGLRPLWAVLHPYGVA